MYNLKKVLGEKKMEDFEGVKKDLSELKIMVEKR